MTDAPPTPSIRRWLVQLMIFILLAGLAVAGWLLLSYQRFQDTPVTLATAEVTFEVPPGSSLKKMTRRLFEQGIINQPRFFTMLGRELDVARRLQAGEYTLRQGMTPRDLLLLMTDGKVVQHDLTLIEGHTFAEMLARIHAHPVIEATLKGLDSAEIMARLGYPGENPEGRFLADTYHFPRNTTDLQFLQRAYQAMQRQLDAAWETRAEGLPLKNPYEALILASIVEKETGKAEERAAIAGVFVRRLQQGMRLQTDPTVIYGLGAQFDGNLRRRDLLNDTPYNTYTRYGLPPTPIAMPGVAAIQAALHPADGDSLYFVSRGDGSHYFSATLKEHERAVDKFQRGKRDITLPQEQQNK
ncbi:MAG: endolytic transglycosylase MltG [Gammaproteobacteria bacterium]